MEVLAIERESGKNDLSDNSYKTIWILLLGFLVLSAITLLVPASPPWLEVVLGSLFVAFAPLDFFIRRGKGLSGYFALVIGVLIFAGLFL